MQSFFQHHRHTEHPLFRETPDPFAISFIGISLYMITGAHGFRKHRCFQEIQLALHHFFNTAVGLGGRNLKRYGRNFQLIKLDNLDILVQIKVIQLTVGTPICCHFRLFCACCSKSQLFNFVNGVPIYLEFCRHYNRSSSATAAISGRSLYCSFATKEATTEANCSRFPGFLVPFRIRKMAEAS